MSELPPKTLNLTCEGCGYLLRGLDPAGVCPECSLAISETIEAVTIRNELPERSPIPKPPPPVHPPLSECSPAWLRTIAVGCGLMVLVHLGLVVWAEIRARVPWQLFDTELLFACLGFVYLIACILVTTIVPSWRPQDRWRTVGGLCSIACALSVAIAAMLVYVAERVPIGQFSSVRETSREFAVALVPSTWLVFNRIAFILTGSSCPATAIWVRATRIIATLIGADFWLNWPAGASFCWVAPWQVWLPDWRSDICGGLLFVVVFFPLPAVMLAIAGVFLWREAKRPVASNRSMTNPTPS